VVSDPYDSCPEFAAHRAATSWFPPRVIVRLAFSAGWKIMLESASSRLLLVTVVLLVMAAITLALGLLLLAVVDLLGMGVFGILWGRQRFYESVEDRD